MLEYQMGSNMAPFMDYRRVENGKPPKQPLTYQTWQQLHKNVLDFTVTTRHLSNWTRRIVFKEILRKPWMQTSILFKSKTVLQVFWNEPNLDKSVEALGTCWSKMVVLQHPLAPPSACPEQCCPRHWWISLDLQDLQPAENGSTGCVSEYDCKFEYLSPGRPSCTMNTLQNGAHSSSWVVFSSVADVRGYAPDPLVPICQARGQTSQRLKPLPWFLLLPWLSPDQTNPAAQSPHLCGKFIKKDPPGRISLLFYPAVCNVM